jgi:hypothetical protein
MGAAVELADLQIADRNQELDHIESRDLRFDWLIIIRMIMSESRPNCICPQSKTDGLSREQYKRLRSGICRLPLGAKALKARLG